MMTKLGCFFIFWGIVDFLASLLGIDFYAMFGIYLDGFAYLYSPVAPGLLGLILILLDILLDKTKDTSHLIEKSMEKDESLILSSLVSVRKGGFFGDIESGTFFITNKRLGYICDFSQVGMFGTIELEVDGDNDFIWQLKDVSSARATAVSVIIKSGEKEFKFLPGFWKIKSIVDSINANMN